MAPVFGFQSKGRAKGPDPACASALEVGSCPEHRAPPEVGYLGGGDAPRMD
eukprot:CAMPEP_0203863014 /NCGR_PEP_ID=MMETSP0359-20131031/13927_1 /ASSEMBLY_ACC=CAM_ASM_000338 /TAXON_ID=268821 /ORGANISM="Scrippsiella Hangoei, Strain SHTV-5" /LENGTH=50 /DNA_ID=CAMNT_0050780501 /DNA_START=65 /DNA_END=214 /DNA_ORIENTATION=-